MSSRPCLAQRVVALWLALVLIAGSAIVFKGRPTEAAFVALQPSDLLMHAARGDAEGVYRFAQAVGSYRLADTRAYINEIYRLAPLVGLDPAILIGQSALETGYWKGKFWLSSLNPAGIGIYDDDQSTSFYWSTGTNAARGHIYHLYTYAAGVPPPDHILYQYRNLTPGVSNAVRLGYDGTKTTIQSLEGSWALMSLYAKGLCNKGNEILNFIARTAPTATPRPLAALTASDGNNPARTTDRDLGTSWAILGNGTPPVRGYLTYDLGEPIRLSSIKWVFRRTGYADYLSIRVSLDRVSWTTLRVVGNAPATQWQTLVTTATARYVRFVFRNPNGDPDLGYLAEVAINGLPISPPTPTPTVTPAPATLAGAPFNPVASWDSVDGSQSNRIHDGDLGTDWRTPATPAPDSAFVALDLGGTATLSGVRWYLSDPVCGATITIEGSSDKETWTALATDSTTIAGQWRAAAFDGSARYVRFLFTLPGTATALGCLAEAEVWGTGIVAAGASDTPTASPPVAASPSAGVIDAPSVVESPAVGEPTTAIQIDPSVEPPASVIATPSLPIETSVPPIETAVPSIGGASTEPTVVATSVKSES